MYAGIKMRKFANLKVNSMFTVFLVTKPEK